MEKIKKLIFDLLFPVRCLGCGKYDEWLCRDCRDKIIINDPAESYFLPENNGSLDGVWAATDYSQALIKKLLYSYKYNFVSDLGEIGSGLLIAFFDRVISNELSFDLIVPVPLARKRIIWRGFNQAEIFAQSLSRKFGWPCRPDVIIRRRYTHPQVGLKASERKVNLSEAFEVPDPRLLAGKKILLIDDVITTGTTMGECAKVIKQAGAREIFGLTLARG